MVGVLDNGYRITRFLLLESTFAKVDSRSKVDPMDCFDKSKSRNESKNTMSEKADSSNAKILAQSSKQKPTPTTTLAPLDQAAALTMLEEIGHIPCAFPISKDKPPAMIQATIKAFLPRKQVRSPLPQPHSHIIGFYARVLARAHCLFDLAYRGWDIC